MDKVDLISSIVSYFKIMWRFVNLSSEMWFILSTFKNWNLWKFKYEWNYFWFFIRIFRELIKYKNILQGVYTSVLRVELNPLFVSFSKKLHIFIYVYHKWRFKDHQKGHWALIDLFRWDGCSIRSEINVIKECLNLRLSIQFERKFDRFDSNSLGQLEYNYHKKNYVIDDRNKLW